MPKLIDHERRKAAYAEATWRVILTQGIDQMSVRNVAAEAGVSIGSLRHLFPRQDDLAAFAMALVAERAERRIRAMSPGGCSSDPVERAWELLAQVLPLDETRRTEAQVWLAFSAAAATRPRLAEVHARQFDALAGLCRDVIAGLVALHRMPADTDIDREARRLHALLDGLTLHALTAGATDAGDLLTRHLHNLTE